MSRARSPKVAVGGLIALIGMSLFSASAAANTVPPTNAGMSTTAFLISLIAPPQCAGLSLTRIQVGGGLGGGGGNALVLGTAASETLNGAGGNDCLVAGGGSDVLNGQGGNDVLLSGPGLVDYLNGSGGTDTCYGQGFIAIPNSCETWVP